MLTLDKIKEPIASDIHDFEYHLRKAMQTDTPLLDRVVRYILKTKGKQVRPMFVMLSAGLCGKINEKASTAAILIEMLHTASLVHDDVVDEADMRRGFFSINALWKNKVAVLVGDYLLSLGLITALKHGEYQVLHIVSKAVEQMSEGELQQIEKSRFMNLNEEEYIEIIRKKTASLIAACCGSGAVAAGAGHQTVEQLTTFGELTGLAFQIKDDLLDFEPGHQTGKSQQNDLKDRKFSLPLIHALKKASFSERHVILRKIKKLSKNPVNASEIVGFIQKRGGFDYANRRMEEYRGEALQILGTFPESQYKKSLADLVMFTTERKY